MTTYVRAGGVYQPIGFDASMFRIGGAYYKYGEALVRVAGAYQQVWRADGPPPAPVGLSASAANGGTVTTSWSWPANVENDYNRVEVQEPGDIARAATGYPATSQVRSGYSNGQAVNLQARTVDNGGQVSDWVSFPSVGAVNAGPGSASVQPPLAWNGSGFTISWYDPGNPYGDIYAVQVLYRLDTDNWSVHSQYGTAGGLRQVNLPVLAWDRVHYAMIRVFNNAGYSDSAFLGAWAPPAPGTIKDIYAIDGNTYAYAAGGYRNDGTVRQGQFSATPMGNNFGMWFYGTQLYDACHGFTPASGDIFMIRAGTEGFTGNLNFTGHPYPTNPGVAPTGSGTGWVSEGVYAGSEASGWETLSPILGSIASGESRGIGIFTFSTLQANYRRMRGPAENGTAGLIRLRW